MEAILHIPLTDLNWVVPSEVQPSLRRYCEQTVKALVDNVGHITIFNKLIFIFKDQISTVVWFQWPFCLILDLEDVTSPSWKQNLAGVFGFLIFLSLWLFSFWQPCARLAPLQTFRQSDPQPPSSKQIHSINLQKNTQLKLYTCKNKKEKSLESFSKAVRPLGGVSLRQQESCYIWKRWRLKKRLQAEKNSFFSISQTAAVRLAAVRGRRPPVAQWTELKVLPLLVEASPGVHL